MTNFSAMSPSLPQGGGGRGVSKEKSKIFFIFYIYILVKSYFELLSIKIYENLRYAFTLYPILRGRVEILKYREIIKFIKYLYSLLNTIYKFVCNNLTTKPKAIVKFIAPSQGTMSALLRRISIDLN